jgi:hypothetical protein
LRDDVDFRSATALVGWGTNLATSGRKFPNMLRRADVKLMSMSNECHDFEVEVQDPNTGAMSILVLRGCVYDDMMCTTTTPTTGGQYICYGNAGGAVLLENNGYNVDVAYRVLSWG